MSISEPLTLRRVLTSTARRLNAIEKTDGSLGWVYVGTPGVDGVDALLTYESPPFQNGWTNALVGDPGGGHAPVSFKMFLNWVHIRGAFTGGPDNSVVFTLPIPGWSPPLAPMPVVMSANYAPEYIQPAIGPLADLSGVYSFHVDINGDVFYGTAGAL